MNIVITDTFKKEFISMFKSDVLIWKFCKKINKSKVINLDYPLDKIKFNFIGISIRWLIYISIKDKVLPILIVKKSNKKYWNNLILNNEIKKICKVKLGKCLDDFDEGKYKMY